MAPSRWRCSSTLGRRWMNSASRAGSFTRRFAARPVALVRAARELAALERASSTELSASAAALADRSAGLDRAYGALVGERRASLDPALDLRFPESHQKASGSLLRTDDPLCDAA